MARDMARDRLGSLGLSFLDVDQDPSEINPFVNKTAGLRVTCTEKTKRLVLGVTLLPIRVVCIVGLLTFGMVISKLATIGLRAQDLDPLEGKPLANWRYGLFTIVLNGRWLLLWSFGFRVRVKGRQASQAEAPIVVANHISGLMEGMFLLRCATMVERHYIDNPLLGPILMATSSIFVDRSDPNSRDVAKRALMKRAGERDWPQTLVFPEGTCTNGNALVQFKLGAFAAGCPVQPVLFRYPNRHHDVSFTFPVTSLSYMLTMLVQCFNKMEVEFLPVYRPTPTEIQHPTVFAANVQKVMAEALGVPRTKHAAEDVTLCIHAQRMKMPVETGMVQWDLLSDNLTSMRVRDAVNVLKQFRTLDQAGKGRIDSAAFVTAMKGLVVEGDGESQLSDEDLHSIFNLLDVGGDGYVDFREYLCGVAVLNGHGRKGEDGEVASLKWTFECLAHGEQFFTKARLEEIICRAMPSLDSDRLNQLFLEADKDEDGVVSRQEFIDFATKHRDDLQLSPSAMLKGLPISMERQSSA